MKIGCCANMLSNGGVGYEHIGYLAKIGFDYIELPLAQLMELDEKELDAVRYELETNGIHCEVCNNFLPAHHKITGPAVDLEAVMSYAKKAVALAHSLGATVIVFGSSGAKNVPEGFSKNEAYSQIVAFLMAISPMLEACGITAVIEPLCMLESNIINTTAEALRLMQDVSRASVKVLVDHYHMSMNGEPLSSIIDAGEDLRHAHFARPEGRAWPLLSHGENYRMFFKALSDMKYNARISVEGYTDDLYNDAPETLKLMRELIE